VSGQRLAPAALYPRERPGTYCIGGWVGPRAGLDGRKVTPHRDSIQDPPARSSVAIPTELPGPHNNSNNNNNNNEVKTKAIPVIIGATGTISKPFRKYMSNIPGKHEVKELQKTVILGTAHILRKVLM